MIRPSGGSIWKHSVCPQAPRQYSRTQQPVGSTSDIDTKFTGQIRDNETGMDYFNARYFTNALGRFNSPDPGNVGADPTDPHGRKLRAVVAKRV